MNFKAVQFAEWQLTVIFLATKGLFFVKSRYLWAASLTFSMHFWSLRKEDTNKKFSSLLRSCLRRDLLDRDLAMWLLLLQFVFHICSRLKLYSMTQLCVIGNCS